LQHYNIIEPVSISDLNSIKCFTDVDMIVIDAVHRASTVISH